MKNKFLTFILFIIMIVLIIGIGIIGVSIYSDFMGEEQTETVYVLDSIATEQPETTKKTQTLQNLGELNLVSGDSSKNEEKKNITYSENINNKFFYNQLTNEQKRIYNGLQENKDKLKQGNYVIEYGDIFPETETEEEGQKQIGADYQTAIEAFTHDNADLFYLDVNKMYLNIETTTKFFKTKHNIYISAATGSTYLSSNFTSTEQIEVAIEQIEQVKNNVLKSLNGNDYQNIGYIHDYLVNNIEYDNSYNEIGSYSLYGALIGKKCVCEGYMKAFKYLANAAGFECEMIQGMATNSSGRTENHAWNCIKLNGTWYQVDTTWDDPIIVGNGKLTNSARYRYFLKGTNTFSQDHSLSYQFSDNGKVFSYPTLSIQDY